MITFNEIVIYTEKVLQTLFQIPEWNGHEED